MMIRLSAFALLALSAVLVAGAADEKKDAKKDGKTEIDKQYAKLDADSDGKVTSSEFAFLPNVVKDARRANNAQLAAIFAKLDKNKDKSISAEEYKKITDHVGTKEDPKKKVEPKKKP